MSNGRAGIAFATGKMGQKFASMEAACRAGSSHIPQHFVLKPPPTPRYHPSRERNAETQDLSCNTEILYNMSGSRAISATVTFYERNSDPD